MDDESKQRFEAAEEAHKMISDDGEEFEDDDEDDVVGGEEEFEEVGEHVQLRRLNSSEATIEAEFAGSRSETLAVCSSVQLSDNHLQSNSGTSSHTLTEVPVNFAAPPPPLQSVQFKEDTVNIKAQAAQARTNQLQSLRCPTSSSKLPPTSVAQSISSTPCPTLPGQKPSLVVDVSNVLCMREVDQQNSPDNRTVSAVQVGKSPSTDGYNWRKYGQKQVKSPQGSRSYYRCTYSECFAKKIEWSDHSNHVIEIICKGHHNHGPPQKISCPRESRRALSTVSSTIAHPARAFNDSDPPTSSKEPARETPVLSETKQNSSASEETPEIDIKEEHADEPEPKRRLKKSNPASPGAVIKAGKKPKCVVHAAGDVGISGDGYRWRKYGQKMVKGNPHPRNYYRCTSAGCPVRKHIERAVENTSGVIITYKGIHDHDMPVPKKRHGPPSAPLVAAAAPASMNNNNNNLQFKKTEVIQNNNQVVVSAAAPASATQWSVDTGGELKSASLEIGEEKAMESARTLLSIGFEIKPC